MTTSEPVSARFICSAGARDGAEPVGRPAPIACAPRIDAVMAIEIAGNWT